MADDLLAAQLRRRATTSIAATCPECDGPLQLLTSGRPSHGGDRLNAMLECTRCGQDWLAEIVLSRGPGRPRRAA